MEDHMTLPCMSQDDHCRMAKPCKYKQGILFGQRDAAWVEQSGKCVELLRRAEGWKDVDGETCDD